MTTDIDTNQIEVRNAATEDRLANLPTSDDATDHLLLEETGFDLPDNRPDEEIPYTKAWLGRDVAKQRKFDDVKAQVYLQCLVLTGNKTASANAAGVSYSTANRWTQNDEEFAELVREAEQAHLDKVILREMQRRGIEGILEPMVAGKDPTIVTYKRVYSDRFLEMLAKRADPQGFGNRDQNVNVNVNTGVMAVPPQDKSQTIEGLGVPIEDVEDAEVIE